jgi:hypothetical protein
VKRNEGVAAAVAAVRVLITAWQKQQESNTQPFKVFIHQGFLIEVLFIYHTMKYSEDILGNQQKKPWC